MKSLKMSRLRVVLILLMVSFFSVSSLEAFFSDISLPKIVHVKKIVTKDSVGFEWQSVAYNPSITGINVYRAEAKVGSAQTYVKIDAIPNRFATHYVDTTIKPNKRYFYTFTTYSGLNESVHGDIVPVQTKPPYRAVKLVSATQVDKDVVKLLWVPSSEPTVTKYIIQRKVGNSKWFFLKKINGRLYPEYVDTTAYRGHKYSYRIFALDELGMSSVFGNVVSVEVK